MIGPRGEPLTTQAPDVDETGSSPTGGGTALQRLATWARTMLRTPAALTAAMILLICVPLRVTAAGTEFGLGDVMSGVLFVVLAIRALRDGLWLSRANAVLLGSVVVATSIVAAAGGDTGASASGWVRFLQLFALVPLAVVLSVRSRRDAELVAHGLVLAAIVQGVVSVIQVVTGTGATYQGANSRAVGTFGAEDVIAASVIIGLAITVCVGLAISATGRRRFGYLATALGLLVPLGLSLSRGSWIATGVALVVVLAYAGWRTFVATAVCGAAAVTVLVGGLGAGSDIVGDRLTSITDSPDSSVNDRYDLWGTAVRMWVDHPLTGVGLKGFPRYRDSYAPLSLNSGSDIGGAGISFQRQELLSPHNQYLLVLSEQGAVGILPFLALLLVTAGAAAVVAWRAPPELRGLGAGLTGLAVWQLAQFVYGDLGGATSLVASVIIGMAAWFGLEQHEPARDASSASVSGSAT